MMLNMSFGSRAAIHTTRQSGAEGGRTFNGQAGCKIFLLRQPDRLPESYVPPIVAILPAMARHEEWLVEAAKRSGTSLERAFEKNIDAALTILGYETKLLGQGHGRVPDGRALALDENYAILWDAKVRLNPYSLGTDDRTIREYITTQSRELSRRYRNIYYVIVSSSFADDFDDTIASIKMETEVSEVILLEAEALVAIVEAKIACTAPANFRAGWPPAIFHQKRWLNRRNGSRVSRLKHETHNVAPHQSHRHRDGEGNPLQTDCEKVGTNGNMRVTTDKLYYEVFGVGEKLHCLWDGNIPALNLEFLDSVDYEYFKYLADIHAGSLTSPHKMRAAIALHTAYFHGLETLFSLIFAGLHAPSVIPAWILEMPHRRIEDISLRR